MPKKTSPLGTNMASIAEVVFVCDVENINKTIVMAIWWKISKVRSTVITFECWTSNCCKRKFSSLNSFLTSRFSILCNLFHCCKDNWYCILRARIVMGEQITNASWRSFLLKPDGISFLPATKPGPSIAIWRPVK